MRQGLYAQQHEVLVSLVGRAAYLQRTLIVTFCHQALHLRSIALDIGSINGYADDKHQHSHYQYILPQTAEIDFHCFFNTTAERAGI